MNFIPLSDRILILPTPEPEPKEGEIIRVRSDVEKSPTDGTVVAAGPGHYENGGYKPMEVTVGDHVQWGKFAGSYVEIDGCKLVLMRESDIQGVIPDVH